MSIYLYVPNLIGYVRVLLLIVCYCTYDTSPVTFYSSYLVSFTLDALDGIAARYFNQCSDFGAILDMLTDRVATLMLGFIAVQIPGAEYKWAVVFFSCIDIVGHWCQYIAAARNAKHHKQVKNKFRILDIYYSNKPMLCILCITAEFFFLGYIFYYTYKPTNLLFIGFWLLNTALCYFKCFLNVLQLINGTMQIVEQETPTKEQESIKTK